MKHDQAASARKPNSPTVKSRRSRHHRHAFEVHFWLNDLLTLIGSTREEELPMLSFGARELPTVFVGFKCEECGDCMLAQRANLLIEH